MLMGDCGFLPAMTPLSETVIADLIRNLLYETTHKKA